MARECADLLIGGTGAERSTPAWRQVYRSLNHSQVKEVCRKATFKRFPAEIQDFGATFIELQTKRHEADYDPLLRNLYRSAVLQDIETAKAAIGKFRKAPRSDKRAFSAYVLLKPRKG